MTRLTMLIIGTNEVEVQTFSAQGRAGFVIELSREHRPLLSSQAVFVDTEAAKTYAEKIVKWCTAESSTVLRQEDLK